MRLFSIILVCLITNPVLAQGEFLELEDGARLYVEETGKGQALVFIPGWTMTCRFFEKQTKHFSDDYHVITYDPRGQGKSDKTAHGNIYAAHASDLRALLLMKKLDNIVLIGWSSGCLTMYEYLRAFGTDRIRKLVFIDEPPKWVGDVATEWVYGSFQDYRSSLKGLTARLSDPNDIIDWMFEDPPDSVARKWMYEAISMTPPQVALSLYVDGLASDYTREAASLNTDIPALFMVRTSWYQQAATWLKANTPHARAEGISSHAMFWEKPEEFNAMLTNFLTTP